LTDIDDRPPVDEPPYWDDDPGEPTTPAGWDPRGPRDPAASHARGDIPPQDTEAEQIVLGLAMTTPGALDTAARHLTAPDFYRPAHETIWRTLHTLHADGHPITSTSLVGALLDNGDLIRVGGGPYIHTLEARAATEIDVEYYARRVDSLARRRRAIDRLTRGLQLLRTPGPDHDVDDVLNTTLTELAEAREQLANPAAPTTWSPVALDAVLQGEYLDPPPTMLMRSDGVYMFYDGSVHTVAGESESGKTWLTLLAVLQLIGDGERCVFIDFEDRADRVVGRLLALGATPTQVRDHFAYIRPDRPLDDDGRAQLAPALAGARLVIMDGVTEAMTMHGLDLNSNADSATFQGLLPRWVADHGPAVVLIDHVVKDKEKQDRHAVGAQHKLAGIDGVAYMVKMIKPFARGRLGEAAVEIAKDRPGWVREHTHGPKRIAKFTLDATRGDVVLIARLDPPDDGKTTGETFEPTYVMEKVSRYVQANPGMSKKAIEGAVNGKATVIRLAIELLIQRQYIGTKAGPRGAIQHFHQKAYYQPGQDPTDDPEDTPETDPTDHPGRDGS